MYVSILKTVRLVKFLEKLNKMIKVLIADNHPIIRMGVKQVLNNASGFEVVDDVSTTSELFEKLEKTSPDVVMLEMDIPEINGIATLRRIKKEYPDVRC